MLRTRIYPNYSETVVVSATDLVRLVDTLEHLRAVTVDGFRPADLAALDHITAAVRAGAPRTWEASR